jgi:NAD(P)-dependent dehydrogenase (short-subunit alcohol dehydrogenase family)
MKTAFITGAGRGLGKGFVDHLLKEGYFVFAGVRNLKPEFKNSSNLEYVKIDVSDDESIENCISEILKKTKSLDLLVNNAGVNKDSVTDNHKEFVSDLKHLKRKYLLDMFNINSVSPLIVVQKFFSLLKADPSFIINISSCRASFHDEFEDKNPNYGYSASKVALNMFTFRSIFDLPKNVKIFSVHPGNVWTDMNKQGQQIPVDQAGKIIAIIQNWKDEFNGSFMRWSGELYPL